MITLPIVNSSLIHFYLKVGRMYFELESYKVTSLTLFPPRSGLPVEQYYDLTLLKKSNLRRNDEL